MAHQLEGVNSLYAGIMGAGKTFAVVHNTRKYDRIVAYDQSGFLFEEVTRFGGEITTERERVAEVLNRATELDMGFRIGFVDESAQHQKWMMQQIEELTKRPAPGERPPFATAFWIEEAAQPFPQTNTPEVLHPEMMRLLRGVQHRRLHILFATQRPHDLPKKMRDMMNDIWIFQLPDDEPAEVAAKKLGNRKLAEPIMELANGFHFHRNPKGRRTGPKRITAT